MTEPTPIDLWKLRAAQDSLQGLEGQAEISRQRIAEMNQAVVDQIKAGGTTGDRLVDLATLRAGEYRPDGANAFRDLEARVAAHVNEPVLVIARSVDYGTHIFGHDDKNRYVTENIGVGILTGPKLFINGRDWAFPTDQYAATGYHAGSEPIEISPGRLDSSVGHFLPLSRIELAGAPIRSVVQGPRFHGDNSPCLEIGIGTEEIDAILDPPRYRFLTRGRELYEAMLNKLMQLPVGESPGPDISHPDEVSS